MTRYTVRPISDRTQFTGKSVHSDFTVTWTTAENLLTAELSRIRARNAVMELDLREGQIRMDGRPKANAKVTSRAVRVIFETPDGSTMTFATDRFVGRYTNLGMHEDWQHNVYAIAKGLEALRMMKRYGIVEADQQYAGFKQLGAGQAMGAASEPLMPRDAAARVIALMAYPGADDDAVAFWTARIAATSLPVDEADARIKAIRRAKANAHPDRHGGDDTRWTTLVPALAVFGAA